ncbi:MAG: hypothetical protein IPG50_29885 [Myxococcales bacterium]|nr:hypothetical protein [Myxococcales bacterium]
MRDNLGNYPEFFAHFHKMTAKALNAYWGRWENLWATACDPSWVPFRPDDATSVASPPM